MGVGVVGGYWRWEPIALGCENAGIVCRSEDSAWRRFERVVASTAAGRRLRGSRSP